MIRLSFCFAFSLTLGLLGTGCKSSQSYDASGVKTVEVVKGQVADWRTVPSQSEIDQLMAKVNDPSNPYANYQRGAPSSNGKYDLPGQAILDAMKKGAPFAGSRESCLTTKFAPTHWSDLQIHYYCIVDVPRYCYTASVAPKRSPTGQGLEMSRREGFKNCMELSNQFVADLKTGSTFLTDQTIPMFQKWIKATNAELIFQYVMFAQTNAFDAKQEQAIINAYYGVTNPADPNDCRKRPTRTEDNKDGTHCLPTKSWATPLAGIGR